MHVSLEETRTHALVPTLTPCSSSAFFQECGSELALPPTACCPQGQTLSNRLRPAEINCLLCPPDLQIELILSYFGRWRKCFLASLCKGAQLGDIFQALWTSWTSQPSTVNMFRFPQVNLEVGRGVTHAKHSPYCLQSLF